MGAGCVIRQHGASQADRQIVTPGLGGKVGSFLHGAPGGQHHLDTRLAGLGNGGFCLVGDLACRVQQGPVQVQGDESDHDEVLLNMVCISAQSKQHTDGVHQQGGHIGHAKLPGDGEEGPLGALHLPGQGGHRGHAGDIEQDEYQHGEGS